MPLSASTYPRGRPTPLAPMGLTVVHEMVHEMYSYSDSTVLSFPRVHWQGREVNHSLPSSVENVNCGI